MAVITIQGDPARGGIPRGSQVRLEALPERRLVWSGKASKSLSLDLDEGKYVVVINYAPDNGIGALKYTHYFYVGVDEAGFKRLTTARPTMLHPVVTSDGTVWRCTLPQCKEEVTSRVAAVLHEAQHRGINPLGGPQSAKAESDVDALRSEVARLSKLVEQLAKEATPVSEDISEEPESLVEGVVGSTITSIEDIPEEK